MTRSLFVLLTVFAVFPAYAQHTAASKNVTDSKAVYVEIPYELSCGIPVIEALVDGKPYRFLLDTGAPITIVVRRIVDELALKPKKKTKKMGDANGVRKRQQQLAIKNMTVGGIPFSTSNALIIENDSYVFSCCDFDGIIGGDFLKRFAVKFDSRAKTVTLTTDAARLVLEQQKWEKMRVYSSKTYTPIKLNDGRYNNILFDSGSGMQALDLDTASYNNYKQRNLLTFTDEEAGYGSSSVGLHGERVNEKAYRATAAEFSFGGHRLRNVPVQTSHTSNIGFVITSYGDVILDYSRKRYCFIPHQEEISWTAERNKISSWVKDSALAVSMVWGEELRKQVAIGDRIVMIGNKRLDDVDRCYRTKLSSLIEEHVTPEKNTILLERANGEQYSVAADLFL